MELGKNQTKWLKALESGEYKQGERVLQADLGNGVGDQYCCLGVACDLAFKDGVSGLYREKHHNIMCYHTKRDYMDDAWNIHYLVEPVIAWLGINSDSQSELAKMNDDGYSFNAIAHYIRENADDIFEEPK